MAGYGCVFCDESKPAEVLITWLTNGVTMAVCLDDLAPMLINVVAVDLGVDPTKFYEAVKRFVDRQAKAAAGQAQQATSPDDSGPAASGAGEATEPGPVAPANPLYPPDDWNPDLKDSETGQ